MDRATLRFKPYIKNNDSEYIEITLIDKDGSIKENIHRKLELKPSPQQQENLRWYFEDYPVFPENPAPEIAERIEAWIKETGTKLFISLFQNQEGEKIIRQIENIIEEINMEIIVSSSTLPNFLWDIIRFPNDDLPLCLRVHSFNYNIDNPKETDQKEPAQENELRILLIISRPQGIQDVPFRSVANSLIKSLHTDKTRSYKIDVLRPPTFGHLQTALHNANALNNPYHVVHFDGHGTYQKLPGSDRKRGYLLFESEQQSDDSTNEFKGVYADGATIGRLLKTTNVPILVMNACRSDQVESVSTPNQTNKVPEATLSVGSLAQEVIASGVSGVVGMRYNVYVTSASNFIANLYSEIAKGRNLSEAVTVSRRQMATRLSEDLFISPINIQDWLVPTVFETNLNYSYFSNFKEKSFEELNNISKSNFPNENIYYDEKPVSPFVTDFIGADEVLLNLDKAFSNNSAVLLYGFAGGGKSATAIEFGKWYSVTGGIKDLDIYTSFNKYLPLSNLYEQIIQIFNKHKISDQSSPQSLREKALSVLKEVEILWIWDNIENITGFPAEKNALWSEDERNELINFLNEATKITPTKFLLISRREEKKWLADSVYKIYIPYLPVDNRFLFVQSLASKTLNVDLVGNHSSNSIKEKFDISSWYNFLRFTKGNPLVMNILALNALNKEYFDSEQINSFLSKLRMGEDCFEDKSEDKKNSINASLSYGFYESFSDEELKYVGFLHFFQSIISVDVIVEMTKLYNQHYPRYKELSEKSTVDLLEKLSDLGVLRSSGNNLQYSNHPLTPWFFRKFFEQNYNEKMATAAFVESMAKRAGMLAAQSLNGNPIAVEIILDEETNFHFAKKLAIDEQLFKALADLMTALRESYEFTGRFLQWKSLVEEILPLFVNPETNLPLDGRESIYNIIVDFQSLIARKLNRGDEAARLQNIYLNWAEQNSYSQSPNMRGSKVFDDPEFEKYVFESTGLGVPEYFDLHNRLTALASMADGLRLSNDPECIVHYEEALSIAKTLKNQTAILAETFNLALSYSSVSAIYDLNEALVLAEEALKVCPHDDKWRLGKCYLLLTEIKVKTFSEYFQPELRTDLTFNEFQVFAQLSKDCQRYIHIAIKTLPTEAIDELGDVHYYAGLYYKKIRDFEKALTHYRDCIKYSDRQRKFLRSGIARFLIAQIYKSEGDLITARSYAQEAKRDFSEIENENSVKLIKSVNAFLANL